MEMERMTLERRGRALLLGTAIAALTAGSATAETFRWGAQGDAATLDPHALAEGFTLAFLGNVYDGLVRRGPELEVEPALATAWEQTDATTWRFELREGVTFHDGRPFTADDVVFSFERASGEGSGISNIIGSIEAVEVVDDYTIDIVTHDPDPILPDSITNWFIMSRGWAEENGAVTPADVEGEATGHATLNSNGTGPFEVTVRQPDVRTELVAFEDWWDEPEHNLDEAVFRPISADATRIAALLSGEVDMVMPVPVQNVEQVDSRPGFSVLQGPELRTIFLGMDQASDELERSNVEDANPFKDVRVRRAIAHAIDIDAIVAKVMRGAATPAGLLVGPGINGFKEELNDRPAFDPEESRRLLAEAGYPEGFAVGMDCPNDRYVNDEALCQAIVSMLARVGIDIDLETMTKSIYFAKLQDLESPFYLLGWTSGTYDAHHPMRFLLHTPGTPEGLGTWNFARYSNPKVDALIQKIGSEMDPEERQRMIDEVHRITKEEMAYIPLHQQALAWGVRDGVDLVQRADNFFHLRWVTVAE